MLQANKPKDIYLHSSFLCAGSVGKIINYVVDNLSSKRLGLLGVATNRTVSSGCGLLCHNNCSRIQYGTPKACTNPNNNAA